MKNNQVGLYVEIEKKLMRKLNQYVKKNNTTKTVVVKTALYKLMAENPKLFYDYIQL